MIDDPSYNFSFSGIKTSVLYFLRKHPVGATHASPLPASGYRLEDICASFQEAVVDVLVAKTIRAARHTNARTVTASGGVSINHRLRTQLTAACQQHGLRLLLAPPHLCTDNAAMIAALAFHKLQQTGPSDLALDIAPSIGLGVAEPNPAP
jgi:N6-L-threonylcarbamoyladenine synthase